MNPYSSTILLFVFIIPLLAIASASPEIFMPGRVAGGHADIEAQCLECHAPWRGALEQKCIDCHSKIDPSTHGSECKTCHLEHKGRNVSIAYFDHLRVDYEITSAHADLSCKECHTKGYLTDPAPACKDCHRQSTVNGLNLREHMEVFGQACLDCHRKGEVSLEDFDHGKVGYRISAKFRSLRCKNCHPGGYRSFDHGVTGYDLVNGHRDLNCKECHVSTYYNASTSACINCHSKPEVSAGLNLENHISDFGRKCLECHGKEGFNLRSFDHSKTGYAIDEDHYRLSCRDCHSKGFREEPTCNSGCHGEGKMYREHVEHGIADYNLRNCLECHRSKEAEKKWDD